MTRRRKFSAKLVFTCSVTAALLLGVGVDSPPVRAQGSGDAPEEAIETPTAQVRQAVNAVLAILQDKRLAREERWRRIAGVIGESFDFQSMSQSVLATSWKRASEVERREFTDYFSQYIEATFRDQIEAYSDQRIEYRGERVQGDRAFVDTIIISGGVETPVTYKLRLSDGPPLRQGGQVANAAEWRAYDVVIEGVSLVSNYRSTFAAIVKSEGMHGLIDDVQRRLDKYKRSSN